MITYKDNNQYSLVYLDGKRIGSIMKSMTGWFYQPDKAPKNARSPEKPTRAEIKRIIESAEND